MTVPNEQEAPIQEMAWPVHLAGDEVAGMITSLELELSNASPIARLVRESSSDVRSDLCATRQDATIACAVRVLCAPRQLLLVRVAAEAKPGEMTLGFLNDGELVVRFDVGPAGCTLGRPCTHAEFESLIVTLAGAESEDSNDEATFISQRFLEAFVGLRSTGLFASKGTSMDRLRAEKLVRGDSEQAVESASLFLALEAEGVLEIDGSIVHAVPEWLDKHPYLRRPARLRIEALELVDAETHRGRRKGLAVLGDQPERVVSLPTAISDRGRDILLEFLPATARAVAEAVQQVLAPPLSPPCRPVRSAASTLAGWLDRATTVSVPEGWHLQSVEQILGPREGMMTAPQALFYPEANIEVLSMGRGGVGLHRTVIALDRDAAVEWTLDGSLVMWRAVGAGHLATRIERLLSATSKKPEISSEAALRLPHAVLSRLLAGAPAAGETDEMPPPLLALAEDPSTRWHQIIVAAKMGESGEGHTTLLIVSGSAEETWRFYLEDGVLGARQITAEEIHAELVAALTTLTRSHLSTAHTLADAGHETVA
jgi:hypothetical protein